MFEHSLYEPETVVTPTQEGDLFHNYEIKSWELSKRIYQILGVSAAVNLLALFVFSTTSVLTMKGCDSPLVGNVCQVLDTIYVGSKLFGTDREYVDAVYDKTELGDGDVTFVDVSGDVPPLSYPEGYFQIANPEQFQAMVEQANNPTIDSGFIAPGIPITTPSTGNSLIDTPQRLPKVNSNPIDGDLPSGFGDAGSNPTTRKPRPGGRVKRPVPDEDDTADNKDPSETPEPLPTPMSSEAVTAVEINKKPLVDFGNDVAAKWEAKEVDLDKEFTLVLDGFITADGKLDRKKSKFDPSKTIGDQKMIDIGKSALEALGDSGYLTFLKVAGVDKITATLSQNGENISVVITSPQNSLERAKSIASNVSLSILVGKGVVKNPSDERTLLDGAKTTNDGKTFVLNFAIPKPIAQEMIKRKLQETLAKQKQQQGPNSTSLSRPNDNTAKK
ncbi:MAG: hypothetical protein ACKVQW_13385 [Pyrinomonadaceae bacterium]